ncbi:SRPBCC family protein, partial [Nocardia salmonicida]|uniref:ATPase n=1 Tax=Nocardia salmonicida TaxID=53431 RepID=UPI00364834CE
GVLLRLVVGARWWSWRTHDCTAPIHLGLSSTDQIGVWRLEVTLLDTGAATELRLVHHLTSEYQLAEIPQIGPGWEYYADMFVAASTHTERPDFADYYPSMSSYYQQRAS